MRMTTITAFKNKGIERGIEDNVFANLWTLWREKKIPFGDLPWGEKVWADGARKLIIKGILPSDAKEDEWEVSGISQDSYDVPFTLQHFYAVGTVFNEITRKDLSKAFEEIQIPDYLQGKNKGWENTFSFLNRGLGLEEETMEKIRQLAKINFLIGVTAANIGSKKEIGKDYEAVAGKTLKPASEVRRMNMAAGAGRKEEREGTKVDNIVYAAKQGGFFSTTEPSQRERLRREENLFRKGVNRRRGFLPSEAKGWFDKDELEAIKKSGLYAPYNKV